MDREERDELVGRLFAQITAKLEDAATAAAEGQSARQHWSAQIRRAENIELAVRDASLLAASIAAILSADPGELPIR